VTKYVYSSPSTFSSCILYTNNASGKPISSTSYSNTTCTGTGSTGTLTYDGSGNEIGSVFSSYNVSLTYDGSNRLTSKIFRSGVILGSGTISADFYYSYTGTNTTYTSYSSWTGSTGSRIANTFDASGNILTTMSYTGLTQAQVQANSGGTLSTTTTSTYGRP
jgi:hypothetical protein